jgi:uncharacterized protein (TIGR03435 family)
MKAILAICVLTASFAVAQTIEFEVATIKPFQPGPGAFLGPGIKDGYFHARTTLQSLIATAFGVGESQVLGPSWLNDADFAIQAQVPAGIPNTDYRKPPDRNMEKMLQALLHKRFALATHTEPRETDVYQLVVAKGGLKIRPLPDDPDGPPVPSNARGAAQMAGKSSMAGLAVQLSLPMAAGKPVVDKTGLEGVYSYFLYFMPVSPTRAAEVDAPILTDAIQQQLGLKLQPAKEPMPVIVVDHIEKTPTEN